MAAFLVHGHKRPVKYYGLGNVVESVAGVFDIRHCRDCERDKRRLNIVTAKLARIVGVRQDGYNRPTISAG